MKKLIIIASMAIGSFGAIEAQAQYVEKVDGKIYIDVQDMPAGTWVPNSLNSDHNEKSATNALYKRFEVASRDEAANLTWNVAKTTCEIKGAGWRLPTIKELTLIYILKELLALAEANPLTYSTYWTRTTSSADATLFWHVYMSSGDTAVEKQTATSNRVRCVREVTN